MNLLIVTPVYPPAIGGGAMYTQVLVNELLEQGLVNSVVVLTENHPDCPRGVQVLQAGRLHLVRLFPFRAGVASKDLLRYFKYGYQNLQFLLIPLMAHHYKITHIFVHSYFQNYLSSIGLAVKLSSYTRKVKLIADIRDPKLPVTKLHRLYQYDDIICCSEGIYKHLSQNALISRKLKVIPIPISVSTPTSEDVETCKARFGLSSKKYIFNANGISKEKGIELTIEVVKRLRAQGEAVVLVVAGKKRDWNSSYEEVVNTGLLKYVGVLPNKDVLALSKGATLVINLSSVEGMPRSSLEAIAVGARVVLPPSVPEFDRSCPEDVAVSNCPIELASQALSILRQKHYHSNYDIGAHSPEKVIPKYLQLLN